MLQLALPLVLSLTASPAESPGKCPISGQPAKEAVSIISETKKVHFCCGNCLNKYIATKENKLSADQKRARWKLLFNGTDLDGFQKPTRDGKWQVRGGVLVGSGGAGVLATKEKYDHFDLTADIRIHDTGERRGNSGIFIRSSALDALNGRWPDGLEIQVDHGDPNFWTGSIWKTARAEKVSTRDKEWFTLRVLAAGPRIRVWVNGELTTDHIQTGPAQRGPVSIQVHHPTDVVEVKNLKIRPLRKL